MRTRVILPIDGFRIRPCDINAGAGYNVFCDVFPASRYPSHTIMIAWAIVKHCQAVGDWKPFTLHEFLETYKQHFDWGFSTFGGLVGSQVSRMAENYKAACEGKCPTIQVSDFLVFGDDEKYYITTAFVSRCYEWLPVRPLLVSQEAEAVGP